MSRPDVDASSRAAGGVAEAVPASVDVALFDFDETLIRPNSLGLLFRAASGRRRLWPLVAPTVLNPGSYRNGVRLAIKRRLYMRCLKGHSSEWLHEAGMTSAARLPINADAVAALEALAGDGLHVWLATASPRAYVEGVVAAYGWPVTRVVGTELSMIEGGFTGVLANECAGDEKVTQLVAALAAAYPSYAVRAAYGNLPVDGPLLNLAERGYNVRRGRISLVHDRSG